MAITSAICESFMLELPVLIHDFTAGTGDTFKLALYTSIATLNKDTTAYSATNEISGTGYTAGGIALTSITPVEVGVTVVFDFADATWAGASFTAAGALLYNSSKDNRAVRVFSFGGDVTVTGAAFTVAFPTPNATDAVIRLAAAA